MVEVENLLALVLIVAPFVALVGWLSWLTRRKSCPKCSYTISSRTGQCVRCGYRLPPDVPTDNVQAT